MSTDVVEAVLSRQNQARQQGKINVTVVNSIAGHYHPGDKVVLFQFSDYAPASIGQHCILFITHKDFREDFYPPRPVYPQLVDMLLIDSQDHVRRYFQWSNHGGLVAEGYAPPNRLGETKKIQDNITEHTYPTLAAERADIINKWAAVDRLRPLLSRKPQRKDIPVFQALLRQRQEGRFHTTEDRRLMDRIAQAIRECLGVMGVNAD